MKYAYDLVINWEGDTKGVRVTPNDSVAFRTESEEAYVHTTDGVKMTRTGKPVICHICGKNHYTNKARTDNTAHQEKRQIRPRIPQ